MIGLLVAAVVMLVLALVLFKGSSLFGKNGGSASARKDGKGTTVLGAAKYRAEDEVCRSNLGQQRLAIQVFQTNADDQFPSTIQETKLGAQFEKCPLGGEPYAYDPAKGRVSCPHPGHESF